MGGASSFVRGEEDARFCKPAELDMDLLNVVLQATWLKYHLTMNTLMMVFCQISVSIRISGRLAELFSLVTTHKNIYTPLACLKRTRGSSGAYERLGGRDDHDSSDHEDPRAVPSNLPRGGTRRCQEVAPHLLLRSPTCA